MNLSRAATIWIDYHRAHSKKKYGPVLPGRSSIGFCQEFGDGPEIGQVTSGTMILTVPESIHRGQQALHQADPLFPPLVRISISFAIIWITALLTHAIQTDDPQALSAARGLCEMGDHRKGNGGRDYFQHHKG
jgi:hypothetical protein